MLPKVAIVGGGPCGLTLARLLECKGINYVVYERDLQSATPTRGGGNLDIHPDTGQRALREANLHDEFLKYARLEDERMLIYDRHGKKWAEFGGDGADAAGGRPEIDRLALRRILLASIPEEKIAWGSQVKNVILRDKGGPVVEFADGTTAEGFDLVVGADGANSKVRPVITQAKPRYSGRHFIESHIRPGNPLYEALAEKYGHGTVAILGGSNQIMIQRQGDASYRIYFGIAVPEDFAKNVADLDDVKRTRQLFHSSEFFAGWSKNVKELIQNCDAFRSWPLYSLSPDDLKWPSVPGVTLVGDAAHVSTPFAGEGVNCAMTDALVLASKISSYGVEGLRHAVRKYEEDMFTRGITLITESQRNGELLSHEDGPSAFLAAMRGSEI